MFNRRIAMSAMSIVTALSLMTGATFAYFTDSASSTGNTFSTGNANLQIALDSEFGAGVYDESISGVTVDTVIPGFSQNYAFWLKNISTAPISLGLIAKLANVSGGSSELQNALQVTLSCDTAGGLVNAGPFSVTDWAAGSAPVGTLVNGEAAKCTMNVSLPTSADETVAGKSVTFDAKFDATQQ